ncbi:hypothetical protein R3P38DRAFT_2911020 [Favolaschia claudopus]|uniref:F-box domain-containing protein n=1 Tax=Favolaschia claudopus TaxID=2862362 RepID=A0AAW0CBW1_9AGAR
MYRSTQPIHDLPPELRLLIVSFIDKNGLWNLTHVSRSFRKLALLPLLERHGFTMSRITGDEITVSEGEYFLLPLIWSIHPIDKLTILPANPYASPPRFLLDVLDALPQVSELTISGRIHRLGALGAARIIERFSQGGQDPVVLVGFGSIRLSQYRWLRPMPFGWGRWIPRLGLSTLTPLQSVFVPAMIGFLVVGCIIESFCFMRNIGSWLFKCCFGPPWNQRVRIDVALGNISGDVLHIQNIAFPLIPRFTLVTFPKNSWRQLIPHLPGLSAPQYAVLLQSLDLGKDLHELSVGSHCSLDLSVLWKFMLKHPCLESLDLQYQSIDRASLPGAREPRPPPTDITRLSAPAEYIPYLLPTEPSITELTISSAADSLHLSAALTTIALSRAEHLLSSLIVYFFYMDDRVQSLPWREWPSDDDEEDSRLGGFTTLILNVTGATYTDSERMGIPRWLARCSGLLSVEFRTRWIPFGEQPALEEAIAQACIEVNANPLEVRFRH